MQGLVVLPEDVQIVPLSEMAPQLRSQISGDDGDFALTRPLSRVPSKVIDANSASLLRQFRSPKTIVEGLLAFSKEIHARPADVLDDAYPLIESCLVARLLVEPGEASGKIEPAFTAGARVGDHVVERCIQALIDSEVYQVTTPGGRSGALKIATARGLNSMKPMLEREARILTQLAGRAAPALLETGILSDGRHYILTEWIDGEDAQTAAWKLREQGTSAAAFDLSGLCADILDAYATLHDEGILHGDVHPRNVLVADCGAVRLIDFGVSGRTDEPGSSRAGVAFFFDPQYAASLRAGKRAPALTLLAEQYSVAALIYTLLCGPHYIDFSWDKDEMLRQIVEDRPVPFDRRGAGTYTAVERVVIRALGKEPSLRFPTTREFALAFREVLETSSSPSRPPTATAESEILLRRVLDVIADPCRSLEHGGSKSPSASVTYGRAGVAWAAYRVACAKEDARLFALADAWAERAAVTVGDDAFYGPAIQITPEVVGIVSPFHTASGISAVQAIIAGARGDRWTADAARGAFLHQTGEPCANPDITLGRASVLLGLMLLLEAPGSSDDDLLIARGDELHESLLAVLHAEPAIGQPGTIDYLGMAHGWAGLLYAALRWSQLRKSEPNSIIRERLDQLASYARFTRRGARWPVQAKAGSISLPGWCNGSAGYTHLWTLAHQIFKTPDYLELAERSAMDAFEGVGGGHGLCCGFAGQAYAQLALYKHTGHAMWLEQAKTLAEKAAATANAVHSHGAENLPFSLYKGDIGVAVLIAELERPETAAMPFFEAIR